MLRFNQITQEDLRNRLSNKKLVFLFDRIVVLGVCDTDYRSRILAKIVDFNKKLIVVHKYYATTKAPCSLCPYNWHKILSAVSQCPSMIRNLLEKSSIEIFEQEEGYTLVMVKLHHSFGYEFNENHLCYLSDKLTLAFSKNIVFNQVTNKRAITTDRTFYREVKHYFRPLTCQNLDNWSSMTKYCHMKMQKTPQMPYEINQVIKLMCSCEDLRLIKGHHYRLCTEQLSNESIKRVSYKLLSNLNFFIGYLSRIPEFSVEIVATESIIDTKILTQKQYECHLKSILSKMSQLQPTDFANLDINKALMLLFNNDKVFYQDIIAQGTFSIEENYAALGVKSSMLDEKLQEFLLRDRKLELGVNIWHWLQNPLQYRRKNLYLRGSVERFCSTKTLNLEFNKDNLSSFNYQLNKHHLFQGLLKGASVKFLPYHQVCIILHGNVSEHKIKQINASRSLEFILNHLAGSQFHSKIIEVANTPPVRQSLSHDWQLRLGALLCYTPLAKLQSRSKFYCYAPATKSYVFELDSIAWQLFLHKGSTLKQYNSALHYFLTGSHTKTSYFRSHENKKRT